MKNILIIGGTSGIGFETARVFLEHGNRVFLVGKQQYKADHAKKELQSYGKAVTVHVADIKNEKSVRDMISAVLRWGLPNFILLSAGEGVFKSFEEFNVKDYRSVFDSEVLGKMMVLKGILPHLVTKTVDIVVIGSTLSYEGIPDAMSYVSAKHAVKGLITALQEEYFHMPWRFIFLAPDDVDTAFLPNGPVHPERTIKPQDLGRFIYSLSDLPESLTPTEIIIKGRVQLSS